MRVWWCPVGVGQARMHAGERTRPQTHTHAHKTGMTKDAQKLFAALIQWQRRDATCHILLHQRWTNFSIGGPQWVLKFDGGAGAVADEESVIESHLIGQNMSSWNM